MDINLTVFTPTYNRAKTLSRCFNSLKKQTYKNFEWLIINDGSTDNTDEVVQSFIDEKPFFEIVYIKQENKGKHIAKNRASELARGEFFITLDSDDAYKETAFETFINAWYEIPKNERHLFYGVSCRTCDMDGNIFGTPMKQKYIDANDLDFKLKYGIKGELGGMVRTDIVKKYKSPDIKGLKFYPENIIWNKVGEKYKSRYLNIALRYYIKDQDNAVTNVKKSKASKEKYYAHAHFINDCWSYRKYARKKYLKHIIGITRDGKANHLTINQILKSVNTPSKKFLVFIFSPVGLLLYKM